MVRPSLNDLAAFAAVASHRSFRKAADAMGVSRSALSHAIIGLEGKLGIRLLNRTTRSVSLTQAGSQLLARLDPVLQDLDQALDTLSEARGTPSGQLRINANKSGSRILLKDVVPRFLDRYPEVELDLVSEGRLVDIVELGFDAGIRLFEAVPQDMVAVSFGGEVRFIAVAAPSYLQNRGTPNTPDDLQNHSCIRQRLPSGKRYRWEFSRRGAEVAVDVPGNLTLDDNDLLVEAAAAGRGIAYVPQYFAQSLLKSRRLVTVLADWCPPTPGLALYYPRNRHMPSSLRAFIDILREADRSG
ncbi:LysR family transcriptional regulator [Devosia sp. ZW T5_3]|uniref:LysR family transcriptional regulator n=1 Tax=Devosia sp. ZW T5_3 TaxID=3378085 RepID=UPI0038534BFB